MSFYLSDIYDTLLFWGEKVLFSVYMYIDYCM